MKFHSTSVHGAVVIEPEKHEDHRGFFARLFSMEEFFAHGLETRYVHANVSRSEPVHTMRGLHYQFGYHAEVKLVRCTAGAIFDVVLDLRPDSNTFGGWYGSELCAESHRMLYVPCGCAHGFLTLTPGAETFYMTSSAYARDYERIVRHNDPRFSITWPSVPAEISEKDANARDFDPVWHRIDELKGFL